MGVHGILDSSETILDAEISKGRVWADCLNSFPSSFPLVVSERVAEYITRQEFTGIELRKMRFALKGMIPAQPCAYYALIPRGRPLAYLSRYFTAENEAGEVEFITQKSQDEVLKTPPNARFVQTIPIVGSWDGSDLLTWRKSDPIGPDGYVVCSRRLLQAIFENRWTIFGAEPIDSIRGWSAKPLTEREWPPETWYPGSQPQDDEWKENWKVAD